MLATHLGWYNTSSTRTHVRFQFSTHAAAGGNVAPNSAFEAADIRIYKATDGAAFSATQRSSANGITMTSPFDSLTGFHDVDIDLTDNTDAGFYAAGSFYSIVLAPDETVDSQTLTGVVLAYFEIGVSPANVTQFGGTAGTFSSGRPEVNTSHIAGSAVSTSSAQIGVNVVNAGGTAWGSGAITAASVATGAIDADALAADAGTEIGTAVWATAARTLTALDEDSTTLDLDATIRSAVGLAAANLDTQLDALPTNAELSTALGTADDAVLAAIAALNDISVADILSGTIEGSTTLVQSLRLMNAALGGKASGLDTTNPVYRDLADSKDRIDATCDASGNRSAVTLDLT